MKRAADRVVAELRASREEIAAHRRSKRFAVRVLVDVHRIGELLFSHYWFPVQVVGVLLLVATVGVVVLSKKELK